MYDSAERMLQECPYFHLQNFGLCDKQQDKTSPSIHHFFKVQKTGGLLVKTSAMTPEKQHF